MRMIRIFRSEGGYPTGEFLFFKSDGREIFMERSSVGAETEARRNRQSVVGAVDFLVVARLVFQFEGEARTYGVRTYGVTCLLGSLCGNYLHLSRPNDAFQDRQCLCNRDQLDAIDCFLVVATV